MAKKDEGRVYFEKGGFNNSKSTKGKKTPAVKPVVKTTPVVKPTTKKKPAVLNALNKQVGTDKEYELLKKEKTQSGDIEKLRKKNAATKKAAEKANIKKFKETESLKEGVKKNELKLGNKYQQYANKAAKKEELKYNKAMAAKKAAGTIGEEYFTRPEINPEDYFVKPNNFVDSSEYFVKPDDVVDPSKAMVKYNKPNMDLVVQSKPSLTTPKPSSSFLDKSKKVGAAIYGKTPLGKLIRAGLLLGGATGVYQATKPDKTENVPASTITQTPSQPITQTPRNIDINSLFPAPTLETYTPREFSPVDYIPSSVGAAPRPSTLPTPKRPTGKSNVELTQGLLSQLPDNTQRNIDTINKAYQDRIANRKPIEDIDISANAEIQKLNTNLQSQLDNLIKAYGSKREVQKAVQQEDPILLQELASIDAQYNLSLNDIQSSYTNALADAQRTQQLTDELLSKTTQQMTGGFEQIAGGLQGGGGADVSTAALLRGLSGAGAAGAAARQFETGVDLLGNIAGGRMSQARSESDLALSRASSKSQAQRGSAIRQADLREQIRQEELDAEKEFLANQQGLAGTLYENTLNERNRAETKLVSAAERRQNLELARQAEDEQLQFDLQNAILQAQQQGDENLEQRTIQLYNATLADREAERDFENQVLSRDLKQAEQDYQYSTNLFNQQSDENLSQREFAMGQQAAKNKFTEDETTREEALRLANTKAMNEYNQGRLLAAKQLLPEDQYNQFIRGVTGQSEPAAPFTAKQATGDIKISTKTADGKATSKIIPQLNVQRVLDAVYNYVLQSMQTVNYSEASEYFNKVFNSGAGEGYLTDLAASTNLSLPEIQALLAQADYPTTAGGFAALVSNRGA